MNQKGFGPLFIILGIILVIGIAGGTYYLFTNNTKSEQSPIKNQVNNIPVSRPGGIQKDSVSSVNSEPFNETNYSFVEKLSRRVIFSKVYTKDMTFYFLTNLVWFKIDSSSKVIDCPLTVQPLMDKDFCGIPMVLISAQPEEVNKYLLPYGKSITKGGSRIVIDISKKLLEEKDQDQIEVVIKNKLEDSLLPFVVNNLSTKLPDLPGRKICFICNLLYISSLQTTVDESEISLMAELKTIYFLKFERQNKENLPREYKNWVLSYYNLESAEGEFLGRIPLEVLSIDDIFK